MNTMFVQTFSRTFILRFQCSFELQRHIIRINRNKNKTYIRYNKIEFINNNINNRCRNNNKIDF